MIRFLKYLLEWALNLIGWGFLLVALSAAQEVTAKHGEDVGNSVLGACAVAAIALLWKTLNLLGLRGFATALFEWVATLLAWVLLGVGFSRIEEVAGRFGEVAGNSLAAACIIMFVILLWKTFSLMGDDEDAGPEVASGESNTDGEEKSSVVKKAVVAGIAAKAYQNILRKPTVIPPPGYVIKGLKQKGVGSTWEVRFSATDRQNITNTTKINKRTRGFSHGAAQFKVEWP